MPITVPPGGTSTVSTSQTDTVSFLGAGTLNIVGVPSAPINVVLTGVTGAGVPDTINLAEATLTLGGGGSVSAQLNYGIGSGGTLNLTSTAGTPGGSSFVFIAPGSRLVLGAGVNLGTLGGIAGFGSGSSIDVSAFATSFSYADAVGGNTGGVLTLRDPSANPVGTLTFTTGDFTNASFNLTPDGSGGTLIDTAYHPFQQLVVGNPDPAAIVTVSASTQPALAGTFSNLGSGSVGPDGVTYTVSGTAAQVKAALAGVTLTPTTPGARATGLAATMSDSSPSSLSTLANTGGLPTTLTVTSAGDALQAGTGNDTLIAGAGNTFINGGPGADTLVGNVAGGTVRGGTGNSVLFSLGDNTLVIGQASADTISAATGTVTVISAVGGRTVIGLGSGTAVVNGQGADTLIGGSGNVFGGISTGTTAVLGSGQAIISAQQGTTVVGGSGADTVGVRGSGILFVAGSGPAYFIGGTGASTVQGGTGGSSTINGGGGGGLLNGGTGGNNFIVGGQQGTTIFGGGNNDVLFAVGSAGTVIKAGNGNETLQGIGSSGNDTFFAGSGNNLIGLGSGQDAVFGGTGNATVVAGTGRDIFAFTNGTAGGTETIIGFKVGTDVLSLQGYAADEASRALAGAQSSPGTSTTAPATTLTLSDNTRITFSGFASVDARVFG